MPSYRLRPDFFTFIAGFDVRNDANEVRFRVEGAWLSTGLTLTDTRTGDVLQLKPALLSAMGRWEILRAGEPVVTFARDGWFMPSFTLDVPGPNDFTITREALLGLDVVFTRPDDGRVARVRSAGLLSTETIIDVEPGQDDALIVATAAILVVLHSAG